MGASYPELTRARDVIIETLKGEEEKFRETLEKGLKILDDEILHNKNAKFSGALAFKLYDTYGFPLDLTQDICKEKKLEVDVEEFEKEMELQRDRARKNWVGSGEISEDKLFFELKEKFGETEFLYHQTTKNKAKILGIYQNFCAVNEISSSQKNSQDSIFIILDKTPFYATSGGQKGDDGNFVLAREITENSIIDYQKINNCIDIFETKKFAGNLFAHFVGDFKGNFKVGDEILALVNNRHRQLRAQNHSATHLLHKALKQVLGNSISQKGSNVDVKQLTFDFNLNRAMTELEIEQVEELVNFYIRQNSEVDTKEMELEEARESGAEALFGEKYDSKVRVVKMGPSVELCGGTHVVNTGNIGVFKIISENGVASGVRRITAKSGFYALQHLKLQEQKLVALLNSLKVKQQFDEVKIDENEFLSSKVGFNDNSFFADENSTSIISDSQRKSILEALDKTSKIGEDWQQTLKDKDKEIEKLKKQIWRNNLQNLTSENVGEIKIANYLFEETDAKDLREITNEVKSWSNFSQSQILAFFAKKDQKISLCLSLSTDLQNRFDASKLITPMIAKLDGKGGGGKKDFAMGGGVKIDGVNEAIAVLKDSLK
jgi:alanyl-tRNA synthetase